MKQSSKQLSISHDAVKYQLSGGAECTVVRQRGATTYFAHIHMQSQCQYPEYGKIAQNAQRTEYIFVNRGTAEVHVNSNVIHMHEGESVTINDGDTYALIAGAEGLECTVLVTDGENAASIINTI